jgi:hypothetical protein
MKSAYIDVRGPWPILIIGVQAWELTGCERSVTIEEALNALAFAEREDILAPYADVIDSLDDRG